MKLSKLSIINYKNIVEANLDFSPRINCFIGTNGMGKTNLLDAIYLLSFCKSAGSVTDTQCIRHDEDFAVVQGFYDLEQKSQVENLLEEMYCGLKRGRKKVFKRNKKAYKRFVDHIGLLPLVMVSPNDADLIAGTGEVRRRFLDGVISQFDAAYLNALTRYNKAMKQRNTLLKDENIVEPELFDIWEEQMAKNGQIIFEKREQFVDTFSPMFQRYYSLISMDKERVSLRYVSHLQEGDFLTMLRQGRSIEKILGYSKRGIHRDDLEMMLGDYPIRREGSQGQNKSYLVALKLAQFDYLKEVTGQTPLLLLDDLFDKLDALRVEQLMTLLSDKCFGQIFITDTNREHLDLILNKINADYRLFEVNNGQMNNKDFCYEEKN